MKKILYLYVLNSLALVAFTMVFGATLLTGEGLFAAGIYENRYIEIQNGQIMPARSGQVIFTDQFNKKGVWEDKVENYRDALKVTKDKLYQGKPTLCISGEHLSQTDTAWHLRSRIIPLSGQGSEFALSLVLSSNYPVTTYKGLDGPTWCSKIFWYDKAGKVCEETPFSYSINPGVLGESVSYDKIPSQAVSFSIQLGFDQPNIDNGHFIMLHSVDFSRLNDKKVYDKTGWFISQIFTEGKISWDADIPKGTSVKFQVATAREKEGVPDNWSDFVGPDGTNKTFYEKPFVIDAPFIRYKAFLIPKGEFRPVLKCVNVGEKKDDQWTRRNDSLPPRVKIISETPSENRRVCLQVRITDDSPILWSKTCFVLDEKDMTTKFTKKDNLYTFKTEKDWSEGLHRLNVTAMDCYGNSILAKKFFYIGKAPKTPMVTLRDDGMTLIDGKPFFPIGIYGVMKREFNNFNLDKAFKDLKEAGFNFAHSYNCPRTDEFLNAAHKYGFKLWTVAREPDKRFIDIERHHPAIIAWYLGDDTSDNTTVHELYDRDDAVKALDPTRITTQADGVGALREISKYQDYVLGTDNFLPEIYPVRTTKPESAHKCVAQTVLDMDRSRLDIKRSGSDTPRSIWPIIQYFQGWGWERFPTMQELRGMSFAAIIHGAHGITWYTYGGTVEPEKKKFNYGVTTSPERWKNISTIATQIQTLSPVLLERTPDIQPKIQVLSGPKKDPLQNDSISCLMKKHEGAVWLLCVNSSPEPVRAQFDFMKIDPTLKDGNVMFENRKITLSNGILADSFQGQDVHIYQLK